MKKIDSTQADIEALDALCQRLAGFEDKISLEWLDGYMATVLAGPRVPPFEEWVSDALGEAWARAIADPADEAQARGVIEKRWKVLAAQLDPQTLEQHPDELRLGPLLYSPDEEEQADQARELTPEQVAELPALGEIWAHGIFDALDTYETDWDAAPAEDDVAQAVQTGLELLALLLHPPGETYEEAVLAFFGKALSRDELVSEAAFALQDLRLLWSQHPPRTAPRSVARQAGRNDPCPCGSGKKFKKCHGA